MNERIYLSPERRDPPHGSYFGYPDVYERDYCEALAAELKPLLESCGFAVRIGERAKTIYRRVPEAIAWGADYYMPLHTNASVNGTQEGKAQGALVLTAADAESQRASELVFARLNALRPSARGVRRQLSFYEINSAKPPVVYPEIAFHDNGGDAKYLVENRSAIAWALCAGVCDYYGVAPPGQSAASPDIARLRELVAEMSALLGAQK